MISIWIYIDFVPFMIIAKSYRSFEAFSITDQVL